MRSIVTGHAVSSLSSTSPVATQNIVFQNQTMVSEELQPNLEERTSKSTTHISAALFKTAKPLNKEGGLRELVGVQEAGVS